MSFDGVWLDVSTFAVEDAFLNGTSPILICGMVIRWRWRSWDVVTLGWLRDDLVGLKCAFWWFLGVEAKNNIMAKQYHCLGVHGVLPTPLFFFWVVKMQFLGNFIFERLQFILCLCARHEHTCHWAQINDNIPGHSQIFNMISRDWENQPHTWGNFRS